LPIPYLRIPKIRLNKSLQNLTNEEGRGSSKNVEEQTDAFYSEISLFNNLLTSSWGN